MSETTRRDPPHIPGGSSTGLTVGPAVWSHLADILTVAAAPVPIVIERTTAGVADEATGEPSRHAASSGTMDETADESAESYSSGRKPGPRQPDVLDAALRAGKTVYGHSTGFGALASHAGDPRAERHQEHLIAHLASGTGPALEGRVARATVFDRLVTLGKGHSAAGDRLISRLVSVLAGPHAPRIPAYGSVGASGDLTPLAHLALALSGDNTDTNDERRWLHGESIAGRKVSVPELPPFAFDRRDALALVNGTSTSVGFAALAWWDMAVLFPVMLASMGTMVRAMNLNRDAYHETVHRLRRQPGQIRTAAALRDVLADSTAGDTDSIGTPDVGRALRGGQHDETSRDPLRHERAIQSAYSFRCIPQILGPSVESLVSAAVTLERELNAVTDNPIFAAPDLVFHGGNFHGQPIAQVCDQMALVAANAAQLMDRQLARITDPMLNHGLPPFLTGATAGEHSGFMGAQVTATALTAEIAAAARRRFLLESRSTNGANQDVVSMSTAAAHGIYTTVPRLREVVSIHLLAAVQAAELAGITRGGEGDTTQEVAAWVRTISPPLGEDRPLAPDIAAIADRLAAWSGAAPELTPVVVGNDLPMWDTLWARLFPDIPAPAWPPAGVVQP